MQTNFVLDIADLYSKTFGSKPYVLPANSPVVEVNKYNTPNQNKSPFSNINTNSLEVFNPIASIKPNNYFSEGGSPLVKEYLGVEIWLPTELQLTDGKKFELPYSVISIAASSTWVETPLAERRGTVKELYSIDDYKITLKGFFIDKKNRLFPNADLKALASVHEAGQPMFLFNALSDIFLKNEDMVVLKSFELPPVEGGRKNMRPFIMQLSSDSIFTLEYTEE